MNPGDEQALAERVVSAMMAKDALSRQFGMEVVAAGPGTATVRMLVRADMMNGFGVCHGGVTFALADTAFAFASNTHGRVSVAIDNSITYPKRVSKGDLLTAVAEEESATKRLGFYRVTVSRAPGDVVVLFRGTVYRTSQNIFPDSE